MSESVWLRLGQGLSPCVAFLIDVLREGAAAGIVAVEDPDHVANVLWTQVLATIHLARVGVGMR